MKFKCTIIMLISSLLVTATSSAGLSLGITTGLNLSSISKKNQPSFVPNGDKNKSFTAGVFVEKQYNSGFIVQTEFSFLKQGEKTKPGGYTFEWKLNYYQISMLFKQKFIRVDKSNLFVMLGPSLGINSSAILKTIDGSDESEIDIINVKKYDPAMMFGGGINFKMRKVSLSFEGRYRYALFTMLEDISLPNDTDRYAIYDHNTGYGLDWRNSSLSIVMQLSLSL